MSTTHEKKTFFATYDWAKSWKDLPWAHDEPTLFLSEICRIRKPGKALDIGCGAGTDSVFLAQQGWDVTALDFMPRALEYTQQRAQKAGVKVTPVEADITEWVVPAAYDLVLDHGLLHNMDPVRYPAYRERIFRALGDDADFVLLHWHPKFAGQGDGRMGPHRVDREAIKDFFAPELQERFFAREEFEDLPDMVGGGMTQAYYWFRRNLAHSRPGELLSQVRSTLTANGIDPARVIESAPAAVPEGLMVRVLGPGRLGISHRELETGTADAAIQHWAAQAGENPASVRKLLMALASENAANVCLAGAPRCEACEVVFCKRQRYR